MQDQSESKPSGTEAGISISLYSGMIVQMFKGLCNTGDGECCGAHSHVAKTRKVREREGCQHMQNYGAIKKSDILVR